MREIRTSGSEGGGAKPIVSPYPYLDFGGRLRIADCEVGISDAGSGVLNRKHRSLFPRTALRLALRIGKAGGKLPILSPKIETGNPKSEIRQPKSNHGKPNQ